MQNFWSKSLFQARNKKIFCKEWKKLNHLAFNWFKTHQDDLCETWTIWKLSGLISFTVSRITARCLEKGPTLKMCMFVCTVLFKMGYITVGMKQTWWESSPLWHRLITDFKCARAYNSTCAASTVIEQRKFTWRTSYTTDYMAVQMQHISHE